MPCERVVGRFPALPSVTWQPETARQGYSKIAQAPCLASFTLPFPFLGCFQQSETAAAELELQCCQGTHEESSHFPVEASSTDVRNKSKKRNARALEPKKEPWAKSPVGVEHISHTTGCGELVSVIHSTGMEAACYQAAGLKHTKGNTLHKRHHEIT